MEQRVSPRPRDRARRRLPARLAASLKNDGSQGTSQVPADQTPGTTAIARFDNGMRRVLALARAVLAEPDCARLRTLIDDAERCYAPSPPLSGRRPQSPFTWWAYFDFYAGPRRRSLGELLIDVERELGQHGELVELLERAQRSRLGLYVHEGYGDDGVLLRELVVEKQPRLRVVTGAYNGQPGEIWLTRMMPLDGSPGRELVATTPYVITEPGERRWREFLADVLGGAEPEARGEAYARFMKRGLHRYFWNDFVSSAQVSQVDGAFFLAGLPRVARMNHAAARRPI